jgi:calcineurin-like phosphoesterase family protein
MKLNYFLAFIFFISVNFCFAQQNNIKHTVYLIGDAGDDEKSGDALLRLQNIITNDSNSSVLFLGDNVYPQGLNIKSQSSKNKMLSQLRVLKTYKGNAYFIPGNHDWKAQKINGYKYIIDQQKFIDAYAIDSLKKLKNVNDGIFYPLSAAPGPNSFLIAEKLRLVIIDSQWFLQQMPFHKVGTFTDKSKKETAKIFYQKMDSILSFSKKNGEQVILAAHHPLFSNGEHGKEKKFFVALIRYTPFQVFGLMGLNRLNSQNMAHPRYKNWKNNILSIINKYDNILYVSGHDHNLQYLQINGADYIVSGAGSKVSKIKSKKHNAKGSYDNATAFVRIECYQDNTFRVFFEIDLFQN